MKSIGAGNPFKQGDKSLGRGSLLKKMAEVYEREFRVVTDSSAFLTSHTKGFDVEVNAPTNGQLHSSLTTDNRIYATYEVMFVKAIKL